MNNIASEHILNWEFWFTSIFILYICAGIVALLSFWVPLATKKGGYNHITGGLVFLAAMGVTATCTVLMTLMRMQDPIAKTPSEGQTVFFLFLAFFMISSGWFGLRVYQLRKPPVGNAIHLEKFNAAILFFIGLYTSYLGIKEGNTLYTYFPLLGVALAAGQYHFWQNWPYEDFKILMRAHMRGMIACVVATLTVFFGILAPRFAWTNDDSLWLWFGPTIVFLPFLLYWNYKLR